MRSRTITSRPPFAVIGARWARSPKRSAGK
jgi:hypothetical protein